MAVGGPVLALGDGGRVEPAVELHGAVVGGEALVLVAGFARGLLRLLGGFLLRDGLPAVLHGVRVVEGGPHVPREVAHPVRETHGAINPLSRRPA